MEQKCSFFIPIFRRRWESVVSRIQEITVEIGGNITKLQNAPKGVNGQIKSIQSQLNDLKSLETQTNQSATAVQKIASSGEKWKTVANFESACHRYRLRWKSPKNVKQLLESIYTMYDFGKSGLYKHMKYRDFDESVFDNVKEKLIDSFRGGKNTAIWKITSRGKG